MTCSLSEAKQKILNKWNWNDPSKSVPVILWGPPGIGKTDLVISLAYERLIKEQPVLSENNFTLSNNKSEILELLTSHFLMIRLAERPIEQLQGMFVPNLKTKTAEFYLPQNIASLDPNTWGIIFLDELDKASEYKFAAATNIIENKIIGDYKLGPNWYIVCAANREEDSYLSNGIPPEIRNRCANIEINLDINDWIDWASLNGVRKDIIDFHKFSEGKWLISDAINSKSFTSPRSWTKASSSIDFTIKNTKEKDPIKNAELIRKELEDFVGQKAASEFYIYNTVISKLNVDYVLSGDYRTDNPKFDVGYVFSFLAKKITTSMLKDKNKLYNLADFIKSTHPDLQIIYLNSIKGTEVFDLLIESGKIDDVIENSLEYLS